MRLQRITKPIRSALALACVALPAFARADALADLKARLQRMSDGASLRATVEFENWTRDGDSDKPRIVDGKVSAQVEQTATGLNIQWDHDELQRATMEVRQHKADPEQSMPTREALSALSVYDLQQYFNGAERVLNILDQATLTGEQSDTLDGKPVHVLSYSSKPPLSGHDRKYVKSIDASGKVWLDADGYPVSLEDDYTAHGSIMVVVSFASTERDEYRYARIGNHLVTTRHVAENDHSGGGENGASRQITTLQFSAPKMAREP